MKKILYVAPILGFQNIGGGEIQLLKTKEYLEKEFDLQIDIFDVINTRIRNYDLVHVFGSEYTLLPIIKASVGINKVIINSPIFYDLNNPILYKFSLKMLRYLPFHTSILNKKLIFEYSDILLVNSSAEKECIIKRFNIPKKKFYVIYNGVDVEYLEKWKNLITEKDIDELYKKYKIKGKYFLYVGRIDKRKNQLNLIKAFNKYFKHKKEYSLVLVGNPNLDEKDYYEKCLKEKRDLNDRVIIINNVNHQEKTLWTLYKGAMCQIIPSLFETPGLSALEGSFFDCPVILTKYGATYEYFKDNAIYVNPKDIDDIGIKMLKFIEEDEKIKKLKIQNIQREIYEKYNWKNVALETFKIYKKYINL